MKKQYYFILIIFISLLAFGAKSALSAAPASSKMANVSFEMPSSVKAGESLDVVVKADTDGISVNSFEEVISYDSNLLSWSGYSDDNAMIKLWIDPPHVADGQIYLSGIIPGGVVGLYDATQSGLSPVPLVHLLFTAQKEGTASFSFIDSKILQNDGKGTPLPHESLSANVIINSNPSYTAKENPEMASESKLNNTVTVNSPNSPISLRAIFWIIIFLLVSGIVVYKLLKYRA